MFSVLDLVFDIAKRLYQKLSLVVPLAALILGPIMPAADGYYFQGYYCPAVLISPMRDDTVYTPVGLGIITSKAGFRIHPVTGKGDFHSGVDLGAKLNDRVYNLLDGVVTRTGYRGALGVAVEIYHPYPNVRSIFGHLNAYSVMPGQWVRRGQVIGYAGSTGRSTGVHVHFTVIKNDTKQYIEPVAFIKQVPHYVAAMNSARARAAVAMNMRKLKQTNLRSSVSSKPLDTESDDLPASASESQPPVVEH